MKTAESDKDLSFIHAYIAESKLVRFQDETDTEFLARFRKHNPIITEVDRGRRNG